MFESGKVLIVTSVSNAIAEANEYLHAISISMGIAFTIYEFYLKNKRKK